MGGVRVLVIGHAGVGDVGSSCETIIRSSTLKYAVPSKKQKNKNIID